MPRPGGGSMGHSRHRKAFGRPSHNRDLIQLSRELNEDADRQVRIRAAQQEEMFDSPAEAFQASRRKQKRQKRKKK